MKIFTKIVSKLTRNFIYTSLSTIAVLSNPLTLNAEIEYVIVKWLPTACLGSCVQNIGQQLQAIPAAAEIIINQQQGQATIRWKPRVPFAYDYINTAMRLVGPSVQDVRVKVR